MTEILNHRPLVIQQANLEWESWDDGDTAKRGVVYWKTLLSRGRTDSSDLTLGVARIPPGEKLHCHRHAQTELYYILKGTGVMEVDSHAGRIEAGDAVFIPGNAIHQISNVGADDLEFIYAFAADSFQDIVYDFDLEGK